MLELLSQISEVENLQRRSRNWSMHCALPRKVCGSELRPFPKLHRSNFVAGFATGFRPSCTPFSPWARRDGSLVAFGGEPLVRVFALSWRFAWPCQETYLTGAAQIDCDMHHRKASCSAHSRFWLLLTRTGSLR